MRHRAAVSSHLNLIHMARADQSHFNRLPMVCMSPGKQPKQGELAETQHHLHMTLPASLWPSETHLPGASALKAQTHLAAREHSGLQILHHRGAQPICKSEQSQALCEPPLGTPPCIFIPSNPTQTHLTAIIRLLQSSMMMCAKAGQNISLNAALRIRTVVAFFFPSKTQTKNRPQAVIQRPETTQLRWYPILLFDHG